MRRAGIASFLSDDPRCATDNRYTLRLLLTAASVRLRKFLDPWRCLDGALFAFVTSAGTDPEAALGDRGPGKPGRRARRPSGTGRWAASPILISRKGQGKETRFLSAPQTHDNTAPDVPQAGIQDLRRPRPRDCRPPRVQPRAAEDETLNEADRGQTPAPPATTPTPWTLRTTIAALRLVGVRSSTIASPTVSEIAAPGDTIPAKAPHVCGCRPRRVLRLIAIAKRSVQGLAHNLVCSYYLQTLVSPSRGLFVFSPWTIVAAVYLPFAISSSQSKAYFQPFLQPVQLHVRRDLLLDPGKLPTSHRWLEGSSNVSVGERIDGWAWDGQQPDYRADQRSRSADGADATRDGDGPIDCYTRILVA